MLIIGFDPGFSSTGIAVFDRGNFRYSVNILSKINKAGNGVFTANIIDRGSPGPMPFEYEKSQYFDPSPNFLDVSQILAYRNIVRDTFLGILNSQSFREVYVGVELPMGAHVGGGAKVDRAFTASVLVVKDALDDLITKEIRVGIFPFTPKRIKKFVTGNGNAKKEIVILKVYQKYGFETSINDIADAYAIGKLMESIKLKKVEDESIGTSETKRA